MIRPSNRRPKASSIVRTIALAFPATLVVADVGWSQALPGAQAEAEADESESYRSWPPDDALYVRPTVPEDFTLEEGGGTPGVFMVDVIVNNTNANLTNTDVANDGETSIAVNPLDPNEIVITSFAGVFGAVFPGGAPFYHSTDGGLTWTQQSTVPAPPGVPAPPPNGCSLCDWTWDWGRNNQLSATILVQSPTVAGVDVVTGTTTDPTMLGAWNWFDPPGPPVQVQVTNNNVPNSLGNADQPWVLVNPDPFTAAQDNVYVGWDDFNDTDGVDGPDMRIAVSYGVNPPNFTVDVQAGNSLGSVNPGLRLAEDPATGFIWALFGRNVAPGPDSSKNMDYMLNRTTDGGANWGLNGNAFGIVVANADSTQPRPKFGTVNALLGGVHHAGVDPVTGDLYYVYGNRDPGTGNDRLAIRRVMSDGGGGVIVGAESFVTGQVEAALPQVAVTQDGTLGVFYYTFEGFSSSDFPIFKAHLALSEDQGATFTTIELLTFLSSAVDNNNGRQRVLGDYMQMQTVGNCFYGSFTANGAPFGRPFANHDPIFFRVCVGPMIQVPGGVDFAATCVGDSATGTLQVCNTGTESLVVSSITSSDAQFAVVTPSAGFPVVISPDFCFPFQVSFTPTSGGDQASVLSITSNDAGNPVVTVPATGIGGEARIVTVIADTGDFGDVCLGDFEDLELTISNAGECDLSVSNITSDSAEFQVAQVMSYPVVIEPGDSLSVPIRFEPSGGFGPRNGTLTVFSNDPDDPMKDVAVAADVPPGDIVVTGSTDFDDVCPEEQATRTVEVCNTGACDLNVTSASVDCLDFTIVSNPFPATLVPGACLDLVIEFTPTSAGPKTCLLTIESDDPDEPSVERVLMGNTPLPMIDVPPDQAFAPTVIQSTGPCSTANPFPISNTGACDLIITDVSITSNALEYSLAGLPSFPIVLPPGGIAGQGDLELVFAPTVLDRDLLGEVSVTYVSEPITGMTTTVTRTLCGEGVDTGARVLVTHAGVPVPLVKSIKLRRINANHNQSGVDTIDNAMDLPLQTVTPTLPCLPFQYHREYGTVSNRIQLAPGFYLVTVRVILDGQNQSQTASFSVQTCDFNPSIVVDFP